MSLELAGTFLKIQTETETNSTGISSQVSLGKQRLMDNTGHRSIKQSIDKSTSIYIPKLRSYSVHYHRHCFGVFCFFLDVSACMAYMAYTGATERGVRVCVCVCVCVWGGGGGVFLNGWKCIKHFENVTFS